MDFSNIKAVFLDFDEMIFDHKFSSIRALRALGNEHPELLDKDDNWLEAEFWKLMDWNYPDVLSKKITNDEARIARIDKLFQMIGIKLSDERLKELSEIYRNEYVKEARYIPGVDRLMNAIKKKGLFLGIITNGMTITQENRLAGLGLNHLVERLIASEEIGVAKPEKDIFDFALKIANCKAEEAVMIGDSWQKDVYGAVNAGWKAIWLKRREEENIDESLAPIAYEPEEIIKILGIEMD